MRIRPFVLVVATGLAGLAGCSTARGAREPVGDVEGPPPASHAFEPPGTPTGGAVDAVSLAEETGLRLDDDGVSVLLAGDGVSARLFPGRDTISIDGRTIAMGQSTRRDGSRVIVPAGGAEAVRRTVAAHRAAPRPQPILMPPPLVLQKPKFPAPRPVAAKVAAGDVPTNWNPSVAARPWRWIVIHHSDDVCGCCATYDKIHRAKGWDECGYHFVIGNGSLTGDGEVEPSGRWPLQKHGAHAKTPDNRFNDFGIGIVLVGDFEKGGGPSPAQYAATVKLTRWLMTTYGISAESVIRHSDTKATECPGRNFPWSRFVGDVAGGARRASLPGTPASDAPIDLGTAPAPLDGLPAARRRVSPAVHRGRRVRRSR